MTTPDDLVKLARECGAVELTDQWNCRVFLGMALQELVAFASRIASQKDALQAAPVQQALTDEELGRIAYKGYDDYWTEDCPARESEAWTACAKAVLSSQAREPEWRPIDSAPKSRELILIFTQSGRIGVETGHYVNNMMHAAKVDGEECHYTHWMPLPSPPHSDAIKETKNG